MNGFFYCNGVHFYEGFWVQKVAVKSYMIARNSIMITAKPETFYFNSCEIPQRHQQTDCFHCREQNHTNKR